MKPRSKYNLRAIALSVTISEAAFWLLLLGLYIVFMRLYPGMQFHNPHWVWAFAIIPVIALIYLMVVRDKNVKLKQLAESHLVALLVPDISSTRSVARFLMLRYGIAFLILALIDPKIGTKLKEVKSDGVDIMLALDVSNSMKAEDLSPNRLELSKQAIQRLINKLAGDRLGIVVFAGDSYVQLPITNDYAAAKLFLDGIDTDIISNQGTAIGSAVDLCRESFDPESEAGKAIIVITDGENHEDNAISAAHRASEEGIIVHAIGMGSPEGAPIPIYNRYGKRTGFKKDKGGNTVVTALNENMLRELVEAGNGLFTRANASNVGLNSMVEELKGMDQGEAETLAFSEYAHRFQIFLTLGLLLILVEATISKKKKKWSEALNIFDV
jgi:Ca-activated chloride channel family protein